MKKVYVIWFIRKVSPAVFLYMPFLATVALREIANEFFVAKIVDNFLFSLNGGVGATMNYLVSALANTPVLPTLVILFSLSGFAAILYKLAQKVKSARLVKSY
ncbi:MAG: hypothetical protein COT67_00455 [Candidatus Tagabacteria bacterium CG09_land_8_20_14_0_10_41_14]|uniref:Uncharacterized protein n=2 Tax=Candidatus Tagaibacteriota TaxID=1817918 RepID=A0A2H0WLZ3_9BACT|nr:MAG: hypothetical protein COT67_00455 [Candidatus Tagabacteria bacterium CG09_land_8_20_14_0_10_41_14]PJE72897.1 MAG: hypothetical protein COV00_02795 [Candidatus Tagabacteria bacterium CG10_big_fil_rev_8_21_14_0_10_40_13]